MDYDEHELHAIMTKNWRENMIGNMILSSATLPKLHELSEVVADFREKFPSAITIDIVSHDCKKSIPILNKTGYAVLPHQLSSNYSEVLAMVSYCIDNMTLLRYFDLEGVVAFIRFVESNGYIPGSWSVTRKFDSIENVTMVTVKKHYLEVMGKLRAEDWPTIHSALMQLRDKKIKPNVHIDHAGNKLRKVEGGQEEQCAIYVTTKDAYTLTDGPTIFLANDVEKVAKFCIQQANIPAKVMEDIVAKIEKNNLVTEKIAEAERELEDAVERNATKSDSSAKKGKKMKMESSKSGGGGGDPDAVESTTSYQLDQQIEQLRSLYKAARLNEIFVPNKAAHSEKWAVKMDTSKSFSSDIDDDIIIQIMSLGDVDDSWKILLLMGIGVFASHRSIAYTEIMKSLADQQKLYLIIASSDYIYGTNYQFCHGYLSKDLTMTQSKVIQALGRLGRSHIQKQYTARFRDDDHIRKLFIEETVKIEAVNMNRLLVSKQSD
jgi:hypothetical protein